MVSNNDKKPEVKKAPPKPRKRWTKDTDGTLGIAKSIAHRFGEEICEEEFFQK